MTRESHSENVSPPFQPDILAKWRARIFFGIFLSGILIVFIPFVLSSIQVIHEKKWMILGVYTLCYLCIVLIVVVRHIPFHVRVIFGLVAFYLIGLSALMTFGLLGSGRIWLLSFSIIASLLLGLRAGLITLAINVCTLSVLGYLLAQGQLGWAKDIIDPMKAWVITSITFAALNTIVTISLALLVRALEQNIAQEEKLIMELTQANEQLVQDQKERRQAEENLRESEAHLQTLIHTIPDLIWLKDQKGIYRYCNPRFEQFFGAKEADIVGKTDYDFVGRELADLFRKNDAAAMDRGKPSINEEKITFSNDGHREILETIRAPMVRSDGQISGVLGIGRDITERVNLQTQLVQAQRMESVGRLAGGVAHDYNNALSVIMGYTELAMTELDPGENVYEDLDQVLTASKRAADITRQLLAFARKQTIAPEVLDVNENVESMLKMLKRLIGEDIDLSWVPGTGLWNVKMDPSQIDQILVNLCVNARDAIKGVGKIVIETSRVTVDDADCSDHTGFVPGNFVLLKVSDDGCGMDMDIQRNVFEPFFTTKAVDKGTGLGMSTVYGIVKQNNGVITLDSRAGKGTTIKVYLPGHEGKFDQSHGENRVDIPSGHGEVILVVEDDLSILNLAEKILKGLGYRVLSARKPKEAILLAKGETGKIHLLLTDVIMPEMNGRKLAEQLQSIYPDLKPMFMSGYTADVIVHHGVLEEGVHFIQKPFSKKDLATAVRKTLGKNKAYPGA